MSAAELEAYFDLLLDKVGSPYFLQAEKSNFLTQAQLKYTLDSLSPSNEEGTVNIEMNSPVLSNLYTLIYETAALNPNGSGEILKTAIQTALNTASGSTEPFMYFLNVSYNGYPCKFTRHNDWYEVQQNTYTAGSATAPRYRQLSANVTVAPALASANVKFTLMKTPKAIDLAGSITSELPAHVHKTVVEMAMDIASTSTRDAEYRELSKTQ